MSGFEFCRALLLPSLVDGVAVIRGVTVGVGLIGDPDVLDRGSPSDKKDFSSKFLAILVVSASSLLPWKAPVGFRSKFKYFLLWSKMLLLSEISFA